MAATSFMCVLPRTILLGKLQQKNKNKWNLNYFIRKYLESIMHNIYLEIYFFYIPKIQKWGLNLLYFCPCDSKHWGWTSLNYSFSLYKSWHQDECVSWAQWHMPMIPYHLGGRKGRPGVEEGQSQLYRKFQANPGYMRPYLNNPLSGGKKKGKKKMHALLVSCICY